MSYLTNHKRVAALRLSMLIGFCCLLAIVSGCVVTSVGGKPAACAKCGKQCHGSHYTPTQVTLPAQGTAPEILTEEPVPAPMILLPGPSTSEPTLPPQSSPPSTPKGGTIESPQSSMEPTGWRPVIKTVKTADPNGAIPIRTVQQAPSASPGQSAPGNVWAALFSPFQSTSKSTSKSATTGATPQLQSPQPLSQKPVEVPVRRLPPTSTYRAPGQPIQTVSHTVSHKADHETTPSVQPVPVPSEPKRLPAVQAVAPPVKRVSPGGKTNPELLKPWNMDEFRPHYSSYSPANNPYRLVSDATPQGSSTRTSPPVIDLRRLTGSTQRSASGAVSEIESKPAPVRSGEVRNGGMPLFGLGRELVKEFRPTNDRKWSQNHAVLQTASFSGDSVTVHNVRYSKYEDGRIVSTRYYDATFNINDIRTIDLVIVPFRGAPRLAHVQASFGFADGRHIGMSIEARYEEGEKYDALGSVMRQFELIYVFADERDLMRIGTEVNKNDVHIYRLKFEPSEVREMFVDALNRANKLSAEPEFYHPLRNSCVTNLIGHVNKGRPKAIPKEYRTLLPGLLDNYAYDLKLVDTTAKTFKEAKENAKVNWLVEKYGDLEYFSAGIRQNMY